MRDAGVVDVRRAGTYRYYRVNQERINMTPTRDEVLAMAVDRTQVQDKPAGEGAPGR